MMPNEDEERALLDELREAEDEKAFADNQPAPPCCVRCKQDSDQCAPYKGGNIDGIICPWCRELIAEDPDAAYIDPPQPRERRVQIGHWHEAIFVGDPKYSLTVYKFGANEPVELPYFDDTGSTDEELVRKIKTYLLFY
jgi:hypothetical protein